MRRIHVGQALCLGCSGTEGPAGPPGGPLRSGLRCATAQARHAIQGQPKVLRKDKEIHAPEEVLQGDHFVGIDGCARSDALEGGLC